MATYLDARRREFAQNGINPTIQVYDTTTAPQPTQPTSAPQPYPTATYRPYYSQPGQGQGQPLTYQQYANGYTPPAAPANQPNGAANPPAPTTLRQFGQQLPGVLMNEITRPAAKPR